MIVVLLVGWRVMMESSDRSCLNHLRIREVSLQIEDVMQSNALRWIASELSADSYRLGRIPFAPGDVVIDIGAHVGIFAIYLALRHPDISIYCFEPDPTNFAHLAANIARNKTLNVFAFNLALTADGRTFEMYRPPDNSGGAGGFHRLRDGHVRSLAPSVTLDKIFETFVPAGCKLLKMDCEGAEYEILSGSAVLDRVSWFSAEFHINDALREAGHGIDQLEQAVARFVPPARMAISRRNMGR